MRHALYFAPAPDHPLWRAGCEWLGRPLDGRGAGQPARPGVAGPWRYGFHATLKAPLRLAEGCTMDDWRAALQQLAQRHRAFAMPPLQVARLARFVALRPQAEPGPDAPLRRLADDAVLSLDSLRAAPTEAERLRHQGPGLTARQRGQAQRLGYPHVLEDWRFHMSLSDAHPPGDDAGLDRCMADAERHFAAALAQPLLGADLCWFVEPTPGAAFELHERFALPGASG